MNSMQMLAEGGLDREARVADCGHEWVPHIRFAENSPAQWAAIAEYINRMDSDTILGRYGSSTSAEKMVEIRRREFAKNPPGPHHLEVVFMPDGTVQGACHAIFLTGERSDMPGSASGLFDISLSVDPRYRGKHVGHAMLFMIEQKARQNPESSGMYIVIRNDDPIMLDIARDFEFEYQPLASAAAGPDVWIRWFKPM